MKENNTAGYDAVDQWIERTRALSLEYSEALRIQLQELRKKPKIKAAGHLTKTTCHGKAGWRQVLDPDESPSGKREVVYLTREKEKLLKQLAMKQYIHSMIVVKEGELSALEAFGRRLARIEKFSRRMAADDDLRKLVQAKPTIRKELLDWQMSDYAAGRFHPENLKVHAVGGRLVRSKSEAMIVAELVQMNIPFRYECEMQLKDVTVYPDFTIRHPVTGQLFLWEHLGMMDDQGYAASALRKIEAYIQSGYIPMINLILTSETKDQPLDFRRVHMVASYYFQEAE